MSVRVRFAPSPTGPLHIGGVRTALYNYLFAKSKGGTFILRIEDTDQQRYVPGAEEYITDALKWFGLIPDEGPGFGGEKGPYRQSERQSVYAGYAMELISAGKAYYAFDTPEELEEMRSRQQDKGVHTPKYDHTVRMEMRNSLTMDTSKVNDLIDSGTPYTIRLKVEPGLEIGFEDRIRGQVNFNSSELDDKILLKSDGLPTYHLANVVDDHLMGITHVIRGEEWLSSTPHHVLLYRAFGWEDIMPEMAHLPLILKPNGKGKLSKRDGAKFGFPVFPVDWQDKEETFKGFREDGFEPAAVMNFLAFLGWNPGTEQELFSLDELVKEFSLDHIVKSGARFDYEKALWFNQQYLIQTPDEEIAKRLGELTADKGWTTDIGYLTKVAGMMKERVHRITEIPESGYYLFTEPEKYDLKTARKRWAPEFDEKKEDLLDLIDSITDFNKEEIANRVKGWIAEHNLKMGQVLPILRLGLTGTMQGPDVFETIELLGKNVVRDRMKKAYQLFSQTNNE